MLSTRQLNTLGLLGRGHAGFLVSTWCHLVSLTLLWAARHSAQSWSPQVRQVQTKGWLEEQQGH